MIKQAFFVLAAGAVLAACQPAIPDSGQGAGFDSFEAEQRKRDAALAGIVPSAPVIAETPLQTATPSDPSAAATAAETARVLAATRPGAPNSGAAPINASPSNPPPAVVNTAGISNENNFDAVSGQRSIDDDAARIAANKAQYEVVTPEALPTRVDSGPNIVAYALSTSNAVGEQVYRRIGLNKAAKYARSCRSFSTPDQAQIDFLARGGPQKDRKGMDPDGDGFACDWDPTPFRRAAQG
ncbi:hypothetical protein [Sulfitobacter mediterraneus]|uniref:hypothetical protein n=1 Tax=Sulfitobacter mediterraneus TaxID=83219 RepID=UPI000EA390F8|nr:hypothetical protein [Sulfitobacter mediterraneus]